MVALGGMNGCLGGGGMHGCSGGACMVALGGMRGCSGGGMHGHCGGARVVAPGGCAWLLQGGHVWLLPRGHAWDTMRYGDTANERPVTHPTGMHSCYRCLPDKNCYAYQYKEPGPRNCVIIHGDDDCIITVGQIFERDDSSVVYIKGIMCVLCCLKISKMYPSFTSFGSNGIPRFCAISSSLVCIA